jgi:glutamine synthetase
VQGTELVTFAHADLSGIVRGRAFPLHQLKSRLATGVGWVPANQALTPFGTIAEPNPWGPIGDLRLLPDETTQTRVTVREDRPPLHFFLCDAVHPDGTAWQACPRSLLKSALMALQTEADVKLLASFEHEFQLQPHGRAAPPPFSLEALRSVEPLGSVLVAVLEEAGLEVHTFLPEYGAHQYEISCLPAIGIASADQASIVRELTREVAREFGQRATFSPIVEPAGAGNGVHIHLSFLDAEDKPVAYDPSCAGSLSERAGQFAAGILRHLRAICAIAAPSAISYLRLRPHRWSTGSGCIGERNREAAIRIAPLSSGEEETAHQFNLEFRPADAAACPHLLLATLVLAGLEGIRHGLPRPAFVDSDPSLLTEEERSDLGVVPLPASLEEALSALEDDRVARSWFPELLLDCYLAVKRTELDIVTGLDEIDICERYQSVY